MLHDVRIAMRSLLGSRRDRGVTATVVLTLALGIGANTAIFSAVDTVLLRPAPVQDWERLAIVWQTDRRTGTTREPASLPDYHDFVARSRSFDTMGAIAAGDVTLARPGHEPLRLAAVSVTGSFLALLRVQPIVGRHFTSAETAVNGPPAVLVTESLWARTFNRSPAAIGSTVRIDDRPRTIVGVVPDVTDFGILQILSSAAYARGFADRAARDKVQVWLPLEPELKQLPRSTHPLFVIGRLAHGRTMAGARQEMASIAADLERTYRENDSRGVHVESLSDVVFGPVRPAFSILAGAVGLVLLITCVNVASLLLARGSTRQRDLAVRRALGAGPGRLARQFMVEAAALTGAAAALGIVLALAALRVLGAIAPADIPRLDLATVDIRVLGALTIASAAVAAIFGAVPLLQARRVDVLDALKAGGGTQGSAGPARRRLRRGLVVAEFALAVMLVVAAALLMKSFWRLQRVDPGFRTDRVLKAEYQLPPTRYPADFRRWPHFREMHAFTAAVLERVERSPGVESAALAGAHPLDPGFTNSFTVVGRESEARDWPEISVRRVTAGYFRTVGLELVRGRLLRDSDRTDAPPVAVINQAAAARFFAGREPLGARISFWGAARTIVGVVSNERFHGLAAAPPIAVYAPLAQAPSVTGAGVLLIAARLDAAAAAGVARRAVADVDPQVAVFGVEPLRETVARSVSRERFVTLLVGLFAALALFLASVGIHGVLSYEVAQRSREIAVRMALGERARSVQRLVVGEAVALGAGGIALGIAGALAVSRLMTALLFEVAPGDPATYAIVPVLLLIVAAAASYGPARRATRIDPAAALRGE